MKKIMTLTAIFFLMCISAVSAKTGDVIGKIYSTDIKAYINGTEIPSYSLDGKTAFIIEDITDHYEYSDPLRTLSCYMYWLNNDSYDVKPDKPGRVLGNVYETDIVTYFRGTKIPCFALNGKMAVAIEDVGNDREWSEYGAKYTWDPVARTISLDVIFDNQYEARQLASEKQINVFINNYVAEVEKNPIHSDWTSQYVRETGIHEITYNDTVIGYEHSFNDINFYQDEEGVWQIVSNNAGQIRWFNLPTFTEIIDDLTLSIPTVDEWLEYFKVNMACTISDSLETDDYIFLDMSQGTPHGSNQILVRIDKKTADCIRYSSKFESVSVWGTKRFDNVKIDKENETVTFRYDTDYIIDLKTGEMTKAG